MADVAQELLITPAGPGNGALPQRRAAPIAPGRGGLGRPAGSKNKRSLDLARWIEHAFGGMTPGQQAASIALVSPDDVASAPDAARELGLVDLGLEPVTLALAVKARRLAKALGCEAFEAWALLARERDALMKYVHQVQPAAREGDTNKLATVYLVPEGEVHDLARLPGDEAQDPDFPELFPEG